MVIVGVWYSRVYAVSKIFSRQLVPVGSSLILCLSNDNGLQWYRGKNPESSDSNYVFPVCVLFTAQLSQIPLKLHRVHLSLQNVHATLLQEAP